MYMLCLGCFLFDKVSRLDAWLQFFFAMEFPSPLSQGSQRLPRMQYDCNTLRMVSENLVR